MMFARKIACFALSLLFVGQVVDAETLPESPYQSVGDVILH